MPKNDLPQRELLKFRGLIRFCENAISKNDVLLSNIWDKISCFIKKKCSYLSKYGHINHIEIDRIYMILSQMDKKARRA